MSRRGLIALIVAALAVPAAVAIGSATASPRAAADQSWTDPGGDGGVGTDIRTVTVRNDPNGGISIQVGSANPIVANHAIAIFIDADRNQATGRNGDDYWMYGGPATGVGFFAWNGSTFVNANPGSFSVGAAAANVTEFRINKADVGNVAGFNFVAVSISIDPPDINVWDSAPDAGYFSYDLTAPPTPTPTPTPTPAPAPAVVKPVIAAPVTTPLKAVAGKRLTLVFSVTRSDNGGPLTSGKLTCVTTLGGKTVAHTQSLQGGKVRVSLLLPAAAKGKLLRVTVTVKVGTRSTTRTVTLRVT